MDDENSAPFTSSRLRSSPHTSSSSTTLIVRQYHQKSSRIILGLFLQRLSLQLHHTKEWLLLVSFIWFGLVPFVAQWIWRRSFLIHELYTTLTSLTPSPADIQNETIHLPVMVENNAIFEHGIFGNVGRSGCMVCHCVELVTRTNNHSLCSRGDFDLEMGFAERCCGRQTLC